MLEKWKLNPKYVLYALIAYAALIASYPFAYTIHYANLSLHNTPGILESFEISDWLINYEGGFVRRGLIGEILYGIYSLTSWNIPIVITLFNFSTLIVFSVFFVRKWLQYRLSLILLPSFILLGAFWVGHNYMWYRRDILIFLICWGVFLCYRGFLLHGKKAYLMFMELILVLTVLIHEASVFYIVPIMIVHYFLHNLQSASCGKSILKAAILALPAAGAFAICSIFKGNKEVADTIWQSWQPLFSQLDSDNIEMGLGVKALTWETTHTFWFHFHTNFLTDYHGVRSIFLWPFVIVSIFYLLANLNKIKIGVRNGLKPFILIKYMHILLTVIVFMLPMFTLLSCDYQRLFLYCIITSFLFYFSMPSEMLAVFYCRSLTYRIKRCCMVMSKGYLGKQWVFFMVFLFAGSPLWKFSIAQVITTSIVGSPLLIIKKFLSIIGTQI